MNEEKQTNQAASLLHVRINNATATVWEGEAQSVSSENSAGKFDVLPMHANFITLVRDKPLTVTSAEGEVHTWKFSEAVIFVEQNHVKIYSDFLKSIAKTRYSTK